MLLATLIMLGQATEQPTLAMTSLDCFPAKTCGGKAEATRLSLQSKLEQAVLAASKSRFRLITPDVVIRILREAGQSEEQARETCLNATCATDLGGALGADYIVQGRIIQIQKRAFELELKVWSIADNTMISSADRTAGSLAGLRPKLKALAREVLGPLMGQSAVEDPGFDDEEDVYEGPELRGSEVRRADGGLVLVGKPRGAQVVLKGPGGERTTRVGAQLSRLQPGVYRWEAQAKGYEAKAGKVTVIVDEVGSLKVRLRKLAMLRVKGGPKRAKVVVEGPGGYSKTIGIGGRLRDLPLGRYRVRVSKRGYEGEFQEVELEDGADETLTFRLKHYGSLHVTGKPEGAQVTIRAPDGAEYKKGLPVVLTKLQRGRYWLKVSRPGYHSEERWVEVRSGAKAEAQLELRKVALGGLSVDGSPKGAKVLLSLDDEPRQGELPVEWRNVPPGSYTLSVEHPGHQPEARRVRIRSGEINKVSVRLAKGVERGRQSNEAPGRAYLELSDDPDSSPRLEGSFDQQVDYKPEFFIDFGLQFLPITFRGLDLTNELDAHLAEQVPDDGWEASGYALGPVFGIGFDGNHALFVSFGGGGPLTTRSATYAYAPIRRPHWRLFCALELGKSDLTTGVAETALGSLSVSHEYLSLRTGFDVRPDCSASGYNGRCFKLAVSLGLRLSRSTSSATWSHSRGVETRVFGQVLNDGNQKPSESECGTNCRLDGTQWVGDWHDMAEEPWPTDAALSLSGVFAGVTYRFEPF